MVWDAVYDGGDVRRMMMARPFTTCAHMYLPQKTRATQSCLPFALCQALRGSLTQQGRS